MAPENTHGWKRRRLSSLPLLSCKFFIYPKFFFYLQFGFHTVKLIIACTLQFPQLLKQPYAGPSVDGSVCLLLGGEHITIPVGKALCLADTLGKEVGIHLLKTKVLDIYLTHVILKVDKPSRIEVVKMLQSADIIMPGESDL